jgi:hypothetical protein
MNAKSETGKDGSADTEHRHFRDFTPTRMNRLLHIYNTSVHAATGMTPEEMEDDPKKQKEYIFSKIYEQNRREKIEDYDLPNGTWVRFMIPKNMMKKRRYQVTPDVVQIVGREGKAYILQAQNGTQKVMNRWRLFPVIESDTGVKVHLDDYKQLKTF